jgi:membrane peptidoglycan carboxypeptidase
MFMDVVTNFTPQAAEPFEPTQADKLERGPVRLRSALQFSLNVPAIKATFIDGLDHVFQRGRDFGLNYLPGAIPVASEGIGTIETRPIDMLTAYGSIANGGVRMPRQILLQVYDSKGQLVWPTSPEQPAGERIISPQTSWIMSDILAGNTQAKINPYWAEWQITDGKKVRPAGYKTGTTSDNRDVHAYGFLAPPETLDTPALVAGVWMGNSNNEPNNGSLSLDSSAPLWSAILGEVSKGEPIADFPSPPAGVSQATVDAHSGLLPGPFTSRTVDEWFIDGTAPTRVDDTKAPVEIDEPSGLLWQEGCLGPAVTVGAMDLSKIESGFPEWQKSNAGWAARAAKGTGVTGGPKKTKTSYFYNSRFAPFGKTWGAGFAPTETCELAPTPPPEPTPCDPLLTECPSPTPPAEGVEVNAFRCLTLDEVTVALSANGLTLGDVRPPGLQFDWVVEDQSPAAGAIAPPGTSVDLRFAQPDKVEGCG